MDLKCLMTQLEARAAEYDNTRLTGQGSVHRLQRQHVFPKQVAHTSMWRWGQVGPANTSAQVPQQKRRCPVGPSLPASLWLAFP